MPTILIVDDNPLDRQLAAGFLEEAGYEIQHADDGRDALEHVRRASPDLVLTDLDMPELNGLELVKVLHEEFSLLPVILMTAKGSEEIASVALQSGASSYVPKRTLGVGLVETVRIVLDAARSRKLRNDIFSCLTATESIFELGYDPGFVTALVEYFRDALDLMRIVPAGDITRICTALTEALINSMDHGNLELDSKLLDGDDPSAYRRLRMQRINDEPYASRRLTVIATLSRAEAVFSIADEGPGFDLTKVPDPTDPENLMRAHGRGLLLIRSFIPDVRFNEKGNRITLRIPRSC